MVDSQRQVNGCSPADQADNDIALDGSNMTPRKDFNLSVMNMKRREMELQV